MDNYLAFLALSEARSAYYPTRKKVTPIKSFQELEIHPKCISVLHSQNITHAMPIQEQAIPGALAGKDMVAIAQTGTGKTLAFGLPALTRIAQNHSKGIKMLVICPTRELAEQIHHVLIPLAKAVNLSCACIYGGVGMNPQAKKLRAKPAIVVATPGRLLDHLQRKNVNFKDLEILTLDEADRMLDMGFLPDIKRINSHLPEIKQTLLFSATFPEATQKKIGFFVNNPVHIEIAPQSTTAENVVQGLYPVASEHKAELLQQLLQQTDVSSTLIFTRTKIRADRVSKKLKANGFRAEAIHGGCTQNKRLAAIRSFSSGQSNILVATDIAARGIDVKGVTHVINYDIPFNPEDYVHRIGRTARAMSSGTAYTFASPGEESSIRSIEKTIGQQLLLQEWEGMAELSKSAANKNSSARRPRRRKSKNSSANATATKPQRNRNRKNRKSRRNSTMQAD